MQMASLMLGGNHGYGELAYYELRTRLGPPCPASLRAPCIIPVFIIRLYLHFLVFLTLKLSNLPYSLLYSTRILACLGLYHH